MAADVTELDITIRCYGPARREAGSETLVVHVAAPATVDEVLRTLAGDPATPAGLVGLLPTCAVAIADELVARNHPVRPGLELALLPPVAGG